MKQQLFGLRKAHIDKLLKKMKIDFSSETTQLEYEFSKWNTENNMLELKIKKLTDQNSFNQGEYELWSFGERRLEKVIQVLKDQKEVEMAEIHQRYEAAANRINHHIAEIDREIQQSEKIFSDLLNQFVYRLENSEWTEDPVEPDHERTQKPEQVKPEQNPYTEQLIGGEPAQNPVQMKPQQHPDNEQITIKQPDYEEEQVFPEVAAGTDQVQATKKIFVTEKDSQEHLSEISFWSDLEDFAFLDDQIDQEFADKMNIQSEPVQPENGVIVNIQSESFQPEKKVTVIIPTAPTQLEPSNEHSELLLEQIDSIKTQYIVGKVAGENLYDLQGNLIVGNNSLITLEIVEKANRCGKLADLIVNMKLTESGVD